MGQIRLGDTVAFRRDVAKKCSNADQVAAIRGVVTEIAGNWLFVKDAIGRVKVMPMSSMSKVARNGVILELV